MDRKLVLATTTVRHPPCPRLHIHQKWSPSCGVPKHTTSCKKDLVLLPLHTCTVVIPSPSLPPPVPARNVSSSSQARAASLPVGDSAAPSRSPESAEKGKRLRQWFSSVSVVLLSIMCGVDGVDDELSGACRRKDCKSLPRKVGKRKRQNKKQKCTRQNNRMSAP